MKKSDQSNNTEPTHEEITALAQQIYEEEGRPDGQSEAHWHEAERRLREQASGDGPKKSAAANRPREGVSA